jgi:hypothetical protein
VIGESAFEECVELKRIKILSAHVVIGEYDFCECHGLVSVQLPTGLQVIGKAWFFSCNSLLTVNVLSSVIEIQFCAFIKCTSLASLALPNGLQFIGDSSFEGCESLESLHVPSTVCKIGNGAFRGCHDLTLIHLPGNFLHTIEEGTYFGCSSLTHVRLPSSVTKIEYNAFGDCPRLIALELPEGLEIIDLRVTDDPYENVVQEPKFGNYGCPSLMNLVIPSERHFAQLDENDDVDEFMEGFKLGSAASNFDDLVGKLQHRFDALPVHQLCYYQSYYQLTEAMQNLEQNMDADPSAGTKVDSFGMTPFHILALSQTPNLSLFQALLTVYQVDIISARDKFGSTPLDYLCLNHTPNSALGIQSLLPAIVAQRLHWLGLNRWKLDILAAMHEALAVVEWSSRRRAIRILSFKLATYERLESISLLELALWKGKIDGCKAAIVTDLGRDEERSPERPRLDKSHVAHVDRQSCRINSGAEVVMSNVLPFLDKVCHHDYYSED